MASSFWFFSALMASVMWGIGYVLTEIVLKTEGITPLFLAIFTSVATIPIFILLGFYYNSYSKGFETLAKNPSLIPLMLLIAFTIIGGTFLVYMSVAEKNAVLTSIIESTYPLFAFIFALIIFKETQINLWTIIGMLSVMSGIAIIYLKGSA